MPVNRGAADRQYHPDAEEVLWVVQLVSTRNVGSLGFAGDPNLFYGFYKLAIINPHSREPLSTTMQLDRLLDKIAFQYTCIADYSEGDSLCARERYSL